ncbi:MAG: DUF2911 domain-containing protein [Gemmatimonadota bacterium]|nr:DUF2911 domain-containing protein [Gemmatimonadota bacterium]
MRRNQMIPTLLLTAVVAACGGGEDMAEHEADQEAEMAAAPATETAAGCFLQGATIEEAGERPSPLHTTELSVGGTEGTLCYGAPSARDREVMGGLVPYGELWRTGANEATAIHLEGPAVIGGIELDAGSYSLYTMPNEGEWEVFLNSSVERWGIPISDEVRETEIGSFTVTPEATDGMVETLDFSFESSGEASAELVMEWENTRIRIPVEAGM